MVQAEVQPRTSGCFCGSTFDEGQIYEPYHVSAADADLVARLPRRSRLAWEPVNGFGGFEVSVVWIEKESAYTFVQERNPGPSQLTSTDYSETKMKKQVSEIARLQESLAKIAAIPAAEERAIKAAAYVRSENYFARKEACRILVGCKASAVPILRKMLQDEPTGGSATIDALAAAGGSAVAPEFVQILDRESAFWQAKAPSLQTGWWNGEGLRWSEVEPLRDR